MKKICFKIDSINPDGKHEAMNGKGDEEDVALRSRRRKRRRRRRRSKRSRRRRRRRRRMYPE